MSPVTEIVKKYRNGKTLREFSQEISEKLPVLISYQTIKNWEDGVNIPHYFTIVPLAMHYTDWRRDFALEVLAAINPEWVPDPKETS